MRCLDTCSTLATPHKLDQRLQETASQRIEGALHCAYHRHTPNRIHASRARNKQVETKSTKNDPNGDWIPHSKLV